MDPKNIIRCNNLHTKEECPSCHHLFIAGYNENSIHNCPSCKNKFQSGKKYNLNKYNGSNNIYYKNGCPAIMSDGRFITYYNSTNELTEQMRRLNGIRNPNEFRIFMQNNGDKFMNAERNHIIKENTCSPSIACSEGWYKLWTQNNGNWSNLDKHQTS